MPHTIESLQAWITGHQEECKESAHYPETLRNVYNAAIWLEEMMKLAGATDKQIGETCFNFGRFAFGRDAFEGAVKFANDFEEWKTRPQHHVFCNKDSSVPVEQCRQCQGLFKDYPPDGKSPDELIAQHFPDATVIPLAGKKHEQNDDCAPRSWTKRD